MDFRVGREDILKKLQDNNLIKMSDDRISLTERGLYVSNNILTELL